MITKKAIVQAAKGIAERSPSSRNASTRLVDRRHPRGLIGRTLHAVGLTPKQIKSIQANRQYEKYLNPSATTWIQEASLQANKGVRWAEVVSTAR